MSLTQQEKDKLHTEYLKLIEFYHKKVKEIVLASERGDPKQRISIPAVIEIRSAFDHVARSHAVMYDCGINGNLTESGLSSYEYCSKNLDKAHGHLYRAAYDAYDVTAIALQEEIEKLINSVSREALFAVIPDAVNKIYNPYHDARKLVTQEKIYKDVTSRAEEEKQFMQYEEATNQLLDVEKTVREYMPALIEYDKEKIPWKKLAIVSFIFGAIGTIAAIWALSN